ncbi:winged helix-turn-helix domain-containing protein [Fodinicola feengrottensis]|uniref:winged helix-turn-helix domain-containing protein n=1 Tax=Fodinicola feengrottensis TaxID=435914 RepID=UPI002443086F|nr:winged helix-turn-helix domain-containing protein [Fodinicola feengrottensis]
MHINGDPAQAPELAANVVDALRAAVDPPATVVDFPAPAVVPTGPDLRISVGARQVVYRRRTIAFTRLEFDLLLFLCERPHRVHRRSSLLAQVWKFPDNMPSERTIDIHVRRIRKKLGTEFDLISTVRGIGYRLDPSDLVALTP